MMHCVPLNILKGLWKTWTGKKLDADKKDRPGIPGDYLLRSDQIKVLDEVLVSARANMPFRLCYMPQTCKAINSLNSSQWQQFLEVYGISLLFGHLPKPVIANLCDLYEVWITSTAQSVTIANIEHLCRKTQDFVRGYEAIYYNSDVNRLQACTINHHWLLHLPDCVVNHGPASYNWSYPLERYCFEVKHHASSKSEINRSIANSLFRQEQQNHLWLLESTDQGHQHPDLIVPTQYPQCTKEILHPDAATRLTNEHIRRLSLLLGFSIDHGKDVKYFKRCQLSDLFIVGSERSQLNTVTNRKDHFICYGGTYGSNTVPGGCHFGSVYLFFIIHSSYYAVVSNWSGVAIDDDVHQITYAKENARIDLVQVVDILCLIGVLKEKDEGRGRITKMVVGALQHVRERGIA
jgi:hypothetical protein